MADDPLYNWLCIDFESVKDYHPTTFGWSFSYTYEPNWFIKYDVVLRSVSWLVQFCFIRNVDKNCELNIESVRLRKDLKDFIEYLFCKFVGSQYVFSDFPFAIREFISFGWNGRSTLKRAIMLGGMYMTALEAEMQLLFSWEHSDLDIHTNQSFYVSTTGESIRAPTGLIGLHNTKEHNIQSIINEGLSLRYSKGGIFFRPPSFLAFTFMSSVRPQASPNYISRSFFKGNATLVVDISGFKLKSYYQGSELVVDEDIPFNRVIRVCDLSSKTDI